MKLAHELQQIDVNPPLNETTATHNKNPEDYDLYLMEADPSRYVMTYDEWQES